MGLDVTGLGDVANLARDLISRLWPNKSDPAYITAQTALIQAQEAGTIQQMNNEFQLALEQIKTNAVEAQNPNWFVAGWRPAVGWVCVGGLLWQFVILPAASLVTGHTVPGPDVTTLIELLGTLLGVGGMRTAEKITGTAGNH